MATFLRLLRAPAANLRIAAPRLSGVRAFATSQILRQATVAVPTKRPVGAFRGGLFGFLLGSSVSGAAAYFYLLEEYKVSNELLTEDIDALRSSIQRIEVYVRSLEEKIEVQEAKSKKK
ncbi:uncharacterized protein H6S33_005856 [Morchella sextelata]|uniref:uncharacterized protein n=1 Tax=Morchella sextelata TaxID=1174677 RepID=UPI001D04AE07|nr:uncharacterized protein H6S33_005856 [Morchella sextelata]KAH0613970.1 hypothetical protein H6S33_005856 [Morchella sextelata]